MLPVLSLLLGIFGMALHLGGPVVRVAELALAVARWEGRVEGALFASAACFALWLIFGRRS